MTVPKTGQKPRQRFRRSAHAGSLANAYLRNFGKGKLEYTGDSLKFYLEKGRLIKQKEIAKEILLADVESITKEAKELGISWKGDNDRFVFENSDSAELIYERVNESLTQRGKATQKHEEEHEGDTKQMQTELARTLSFTLPIVDSLFDVLRSLHGQVYWNLMSNYAKRLEENLKSFSDQKIALSNLEFVQLLLAINEHNAEAVSKEAYRLLEFVYDYFGGLTSDDAFLAQVHPNSQDARTIIQSYYVLNDIILAAIVGDENIKDEINQLAIMLDNLSREAGFQMSVAEITNAISKLSEENGKETVIEECRASLQAAVKTTNHV